MVEVATVVAAVTAVLAAVVAVSVLATDIAVLLMLRCSSELRWRSAHCGSGVPPAPGHWGAHDPLDAAMVFPQHPATGGGHVA